MRLPFGCSTKFNDYLNVKINGISYADCSEELPYGMLYFNEKILNKFNFTKDIYTDDYIKTYRIVFKVYCTIEGWKQYIIDNSKISYYISDLRIIGEAWNNFLKYVSDNNIEIDLIKILHELFEEGKYKEIFRKKEYFIFNLVDAKCNLDKALLDGYMKDILMKAFDLEIEESHRTQYTYSVIDIINLGR